MPVVFVFALEQRRPTAGVGEGGARRRRYRAQARRGTAHSWVWLEWLHHRHRRNRREHSQPSCSRASTNLRALFLVKKRARVIDRLSSDIEEQPIPALAEYVAPIVSSSPPLGVPERERHRPDDC